MAVPFVLIVADGRRMGRLATHCERIRSPSRPGLPPGQPVQCAPGRRAEEERLFERFREELKLVEGTT